MFGYACAKHERLYHGLVYIETQDMSERGHIVYPFNRQTVEQIYKKRCV